jgi:hypothetical protein
LNKNYFFKKILKEIKTEDRKGKKGKREKGKKRKMTSSNNLLTPERAIQLGEYFQKCQRILKVNTIKN